MSCLYTDEKSVQIIISLLKAHNVRKVVSSPGTMNVTFIGSIQDDDFLKFILQLMKGQLHTLPVD